MDRPLQKLLPAVVATALIGAAISVGSAGGAADAASHADAGGAAGGATQAGRLETLVPIKSVPGAKRDATIRGYVWLCGGPAPGGCRVATIGTCTPGAGCVTTDRVTVTNGDGTHVAAAKLRRARFSTKVPAGRYTMTLLADGRHVHGRVTQTQTVTARAGRTTTVKFEFDVP